VESQLADLQRDARCLSQTVTDLKTEVHLAEQPKVIPDIISVEIPIDKTTPPPLPEEVIAAITIEPTPLEKPTLSLTQKEVAGIEMQLGRVWSVRLGILLLTTGFVFLSRYTYDNIIRDLGPGIRLTLMYLLSFALTAAGLFCEGWKDSLKSYGRIVAAGGLAAIYYCGFAAHNVEALRVIESPVIASVLLTLSAALFCAASLWKESRVMLSTSLALAFYSISVNPIGWMACLSAVILAAFGITMMIRYRWVEVGFLVLIGSYLSFTWWQFAVSQGDSSISQSFLIAYWILFAGASILARRDMDEDRHLFFSSFNNAAFFFLFSFQIETGQWMERHWLFCFIFGATLMAMAFATRNYFPERTRIVHLVKGAGLITLGLALLLSGHHLFIAFLIEAIVLMALNLKNPHPLKIGASWIVGILSCLALTTTPLADIPSIALIFGVIGWLAMGALHRFTDRTDGAPDLHPGGAVAAVIAIAFLVFGFMSGWPHPDRVLTLGVIGAITTGLALREKFRTHAFDALIVIHFAALVAFISLFSLPTLANQTLLISAALALLISVPLVFLCKKETTPDDALPLHLLSGIFLALSLLFIGLTLDQSDLPKALTLSIIFLIPLAGSITARFTGLLAHSLVPFAMHVALVHFGLNTLLDGSLLMIGLIITIIHFAFIRKYHRLDDRPFLEGALFLIAAALWGLWIVQVLANPALPMTLTAVALLLASRFFAPALAPVISVPFFAAGFALAFLFGQSGELYLCLLAPLALHLFRSFHNDTSKHQALAIISLLLLWAQLTRDAPPLPLAAVWAITGTVLLLTGLGLKSRCFRLIGLIILAASLGHLMLIDLIKLNPLPRILSFMTLGLGLLGLGFVYNRYQDRLKQIL
jgi:uncharacterized membrane protein